MDEASQILKQIHHGETFAAERLLPLVCNELRLPAAHRLAREQPGQTLDSTALVHEAYLRLVGGQQFDGRGHFFAAAAESMRRILVEAAWRKAAKKRGGGRVRVELAENFLGAKADSDILAVDEASTNSHPKTLKWPN